MSDRLLVVLLALLLVAPLWFLLDLEIFGPAEPETGEDPLRSLSMEEMMRHADGLMDHAATRSGALAAN
ncbi:hypothetical protein AAFN88_10295 [Pelagibius sp. CAU 1746]|uniref:hypothetical protein n=1 Tax=Pelagibius sp. CAU 1746 TaxID=3140370 RepID=UPI00325AAFDB